jgi:hypothetical protein
MTRAGIGDLRVGDSVRNEIGRVSLLTPLKRFGRRLLSLRRKLAAGNSAGRVMNEGNSI